MITKDANRQAECLREIDRHIKAWSESPTLSEVGTRMGINKVSVHLLVKRLKADGLIVTSGSSWRNMRLTAAGEAVASGAVPGFHDRDALRLRRE